MKRSSLTLRQLLSDLNRYLRNLAMKQIASALVMLFVLSSNVFAAVNGYCDGRRSNQEVEQCYQNVIEVNVSQIKQNYERLMQSPKLTQQQKQQLQQNQSAWVANVSNYCNNDIRCYSDSAKDRNYLLASKLKNQ
jgi:uncharacterized protein YecT (DUF1311 family)